MPEDNGGGDGDEELGETAEKLGGIASRFQDSDAESETTEATDTTETTDMSETTEATDSTETTETTSGKATPSRDMTETTATTDTTGATETTETTGVSEATEATEATPQPGDEDFDLKEHWNGRTVYLSDELVGEVEATSGKLQADFRSKYGRALKMNRDFYPAVFRAALHDTSLREELGLED